MFFEEYAKENRFDPLVADNWYLQPSERIWAKKVMLFTKNILVLSYLFLNHISILGCPQSFILP